MSDAKLQISQGPIILLACPLQHRVELGNPIRVRVALGNVADSTVRIRSSFVFGAWLNASVQGPRGEVLEQVAHIDAGRGSVTFVPPNELVDTVIDLRCPSGGETKRYPCSAPYNFTARGTYTVEMTYNYACGYGPCAPDSLRIDQIRAQEFQVVLK